MYRFRSDLALVGQQRGAVASRRAVFAAIPRGCANQQSTHSPRRDPSNGTLDGVHAVTHVYWSLPCSGNAMPVEKWLVIRDRAQPALRFAVNEWSATTHAPLTKNAARIHNRLCSRSTTARAQPGSWPTAVARHAVRAAAPARRRRHDLDRHLRELQRPAPDITTPC